MSKLREDLVVELEARGHVLRTDEDGDVDLYALDLSGPEEGYHNGPQCVKCHEYWCVYCVGGRYDTLEPCDA